MSIPQDRPSPRRRRAGRVAAGARALPVCADPLERRTMLSVSMDFAAGRVIVTGTDGADQVVVRVSPFNPADLHVQEGQSLAVFRLQQVNAIEVTGSGGDDTLTVDTTGGLLGRAGAQVLVNYQGGAGSDTVALTGGPAGGRVSQTLTLGPAADAGSSVSKAGAVAQTVNFVGVEWLVDLSVADSLAVVLGGAANLVALGNGPLVNGLATASVKAYDVTPCDHEAPLPAPQPASQAAPGSAAPSGSISLAGSTAPVTAVDPATVPDEKARKKLLRGYQQEARKEKARQLKQLRQQQREQKARQKHEAKLKRQSGTGATAAAVAAPEAAPAVTVGQELVLGKAYLPLQFANKARVTLDAGAGDDWIAVNHAVKAAGMTSLQVNGGAGADTLAEQAKPAGVTWAAAGAENVSARGFILVNECTDPAPEPAPGPGPTTPNNPMTPEVPTNASASASSSRDRDDDGKDDSNASGSSDRDASSTSSRDSDSNSTSSRDAGASGSNGD